MISSEQNPFEIAKDNKRPLILDGAMGSLLQQKGFKSNTSAWMTHINNESPETITLIHKDYIEAGADIITTNTFRTNPFALGETSLSKKEVKRAISLAKSAIGINDILLAGSNAPAEDCYQKERKISYKKLKENHLYHIDFLMDNGVDFILNETQSHIDEIEITSNHCSKNSIPFVVSLYIQDNMKILSGESVQDVVNFIWEHKPLAIGINCITPATFSKVMKLLNPTLNFGFYLNCLKGSPESATLECDISPVEYGEMIKNYLQFNPSFIGACCGSSPEHIHKIKEVIDG